MADWIGVARTNYFKVKDIKIFKAHCSLLKIKCDLNSQEGFVGLDSEDGYWPRCFNAEQVKSVGLDITAKYFNSSDSEELEFDIVKFVGTHLQEGSVAVFVVAGHEKLRYLTGHSCAVNSAGEVVSVDIYDVYELAAETFKIPKESITLAEY